MFKCTVTRNIVRFKLEDCFNENGDYVASIDYNIEIFYLACESKQFMYINIKSHFTKEKLKKVFKKGYAKKTCEKKKNSNNFFFNFYQVCEKDNCKRGFPFKEWVVSYRGARRRWDIKLVFEPKKNCFFFFLDY